MSLQQLPPNWTPQQLAALNALGEVRAAFVLVRDVANQTGDTSPEAAKVKADLTTLADSLWRDVKAYPLVLSLPT